MMNYKTLIAAALLSLSVASSAFAGGEGRGASLTPAYGSAGSTQSANGTVFRFDNTTIPENGQNGPVESPNSLPKGAMDGTGAVRYAQSVDRYFAQRAAHRFARLQAQQAHHHG